MFSQFYKRRLFNKPEPTDLLFTASDISIDIIIIPAPKRHFVYYVHNENITVKQFQWLLLDQFVLI